LAFEKSASAIMASHADSAHDLLNLPISNLRQYIELFPHDGLSKVITGYLSSGVSRFPLRDKPKDAPDLSEGGVALNDTDPLSQEDCLVLMTVGGLEDSQSSALGIAN
jgi:superkiller protein 3